MARDIVQLLHRVVSAGSKGMALGCRLALAQGGIGVIGGTGMGVHLGHTVAVQHWRGHKDVRVRDGPRQRLLWEGRPLWRQQRVLGVQALCGEQLFIRQDSVIGHAKFIRQAPLWGQDPVLGHGPDGPAWPFSRQRLLLRHLDDVEGEGATGCEVWKVPPPHVILISFLVSCKTRERRK